MNKLIRALASLFLVSSLRGRDLATHQGEYLTLDINTSEFCGLRIGDSLSDIKSVFGEPTQLNKTNYCYPKKGISFFLAKGKLCSIYIWFSPIGADEPFHQYQSEFTPAKLKLILGENEYKEIRKGLSKSQIEKTLALNFNYDEPDNEGRSALEFKQQRHKKYESFMTCFELHQEHNLLGLWVAH